MKSLVSIPVFFALAAGFLLTPGFAQDGWDFPISPDSASPDSASPDSAGPPAIEASATEPNAANDPVRSNAGVTAGVNRINGPDGTPLGWDYTPALPDARDNTPDDEVPSELELLSQSMTGVGFDAAFYDAESDNPLTPVSVVLRALDKITARYSDIEIPLGENAQFGTLQIIPRICDKRPPEEFPETSVFLEVFDMIVTPQGRGKDANRRDQEASALIAGRGVADEPAEQNPEALAVTGPGEAVPAGETSIPAAGAMVDMSSGIPVFTGWMFASSVGLNPLDHAVYDVWVIDCNMVDPEQTAGSE